MSNSNIPSPASPSEPHPSNVNLRSASVALESVSTQIRNIRQSFLEIARNHNAHGIGPSHSAIILSNPRERAEQPELEMEMDRLRSNLPPSVMTHLEHFESNFRPRRELSSDSSGSSPFYPDTETSPPQLSHSSDGQPSAAAMFTLPALNSFQAAGTISPPRRRWLEYPFRRRRELDSDDPSTFLGRRVAAREAGGHPNSTDPPLHHFEHTLVRSSELQGPAAQFLAAFSGSFRGDTLPQSSADGSTLVQGSRRSHNRDTGSEESPSSPLPRQSRSARSTRRNELMWRISTAPDAATSNVSNMHATPSNTQTAFTAPSSVRMYHLPPLNQVGQHETIPDESRTYSVRRRLNADGEEHVHNITLSDWEDDYAISVTRNVQEPYASSVRHTSTSSVTPIPPNAYLHTRVERYPGRSGQQTSAQAFSDSANAPAPRPARRRRGWGMS